MTLTPSWATVASSMGSIWYVPSPTMETTSESGRASLTPRAAGTS